MDNRHHKINYLELPAKDLAVTKSFFASVFGWSFTDYGPDYTSINNQELDGGFYKSDLVSSAKEGAPLIVFYSKNLEESQEKIEACGGKISQPIFDFPGGRRFHFIEPSGNELAVWSEIID